MVQPINYMLDVADPIAKATQGFAQGLQLGASFAEMQKERAKEEAAALAQQQMQNDLANLAENPTAEGYAKIMTMYPQLSENLQRAYNTMDQGQQKHSLNIASQTFAALNSGQPQIAKDLLDQNIAAYENSGKVNEANSLRAISKMIDLNPKGAQASVGMMIAATNPDKFADIYGKLGEEGRAQQMQPLEIAQKQAQIGLTQQQAAKTGYEAQQAGFEAQDTPQRLALQNQQTQANINKVYADIENNAGRLALDQNKLQSDVEMKLYELGQANNKLSDSSQKLVNDSIVSSTTAASASSQLNDLAGRLEKEGGGYGVASRAGEWLKNATGNQSYMTSLRQEYIRLRNSEAMKMLPPGPATDKDVALAMEGFPKETADAKEIASFLRGMAKINQRTAAYEEAKAEWVNQNNGLGSNKRDIDVLGIKVPTGTTFSKFASQNMGKILKQQQNQRVVQQVQSGQRSYMSAVQ